MTIMQRTICQVRPGKWEALEAYEKKWDALEERLGGFAKKRRYRCLVGGEGSHTWVWEREWESYTAAEAALQRLWKEPEAQALGEETDSLIANIRREHYVLLEW
jgi:hypothetical protein